VYVYVCNFFRFYVACVLLILELHSFSSCAHLSTRICRRDFVCAFLSACCCRRPIVVRAFVYLFLFFFLFMNPFSTP